MPVEEIQMNAEERMDHAIELLKENFASVRTGRASALVLDRIKAEYYGVPTPINQMAAIKTPDAHMLVIEPWDKSALKAIEQAIMASDLGINPNNDGSCIRLSFPALTEERRRELAKQCHTYAEESRIAIRAARGDANKHLERAIKEENLPEDDERRGEAAIQKLTNDYIAKVDALLKTKEAEVMSI
jgi:ribosome recycling factor